MGSPGHVAVIMDGNRRFARSAGKKPWEGHEAGSKKLGEFLKWCREFGIREATLYAFSIDNFSRPKEEFDFLMDLFRKGFEELKKSDEVRENGLRINFLGRIDMFPEDVSRAMREIMESTKGNDRYVLNLCMAYGGRAEISDAVRRMIADSASGKLDPERMDDEAIKDYLYASGEPDMIIRTGGEKRLSGFLLYQCSYSELFFVDRMWPDFRKEDFAACIEEFRQRERRFGR